MAQFIISDKAINTLRQAGATDETIVRIGRALRDLDHSEFPVDEMDDSIVCLGVKLSFFRDHIQAIDFVMMPGEIPGHA